LGSNQGDQIGRIFTYVAILGGGSFWKIKYVAQMLGLLFSTIKVSVVLFAKIV
jgi:hypothetical protein